MLNALYSWTAAPSNPRAQTGDDDVGVFPAPNSIQRAGATNNATIAAPTISIEPEDEEDQEQDSDDTLKGGRSKGKSKSRVQQLMPEATIQKPRKSRKVALAPGRSQLDWANLTRGGVDLRGGLGEFMRITPSELAKHKTKEDAWMALNGKVYYITPYIEYHPGGEKELMRAAGRDGTKLFMNTHAWVNIDHMLQYTLIGMLVPEGRR